MTKVQLKKFRDMLEARRQEIIKRAQQTLEEDMTLDANDLPDEMDLASSEYLQSFTFRLRGREKSFLDKIQKALIKIEDGSFGICEECGEEISVKRLEARPETTLCIRCKEDQERMEKDTSWGPVSFGLRASPSPGSVVMAQVGACRPPSSPSCWSPPPCIAFGESCFARQEACGARRS